MFTITPPAPRAFMTRRVLHAMEDAVEVDAYDPMPVIRAALVDRGRLLANASVVHQAVEASQLAGGAIDERADGGLVADIGLDGDRPAPRLLGGVGAS